MADVGRCVGRICLRNKFSYCNLPFFTPLNYVRIIQSRLTSQKIQTLSKTQNCDEIGPVNPESNLRQVRFVAKENASPLEDRLRKCREELQEWNQAFWTKHNKNFGGAKKQFEDDLLKTKDSGNQTITADEMSTFYKQFLDKNWNNHYSYLFEWYRKHFYVTYLHLQVFLESLGKKIKY